MINCYECIGCKHYRGDSGCRPYCHYALDTEKCRVIDRRIVPAKECYENKVFFEPLEEVKE